MGQGKFSEHEEELDQDGIDDFDFLASSEISKSPLLGGSDDSSSEDESGSRRFKKERKLEAEREEAREAKEEEAVEKKRRRSSSLPIDEEVPEKKKKQDVKEREKSDKREKTKTDERERSRERDKSKERDRHKRERGSRFDRWDHYEPNKEREKDRKKESKSPDRKKESKSPDRKKESKSPERKRRSVSPERKRSPSFKKRHSEDREDNDRSSSSSNGNSRSSPKNNEDFNQESHSPELKEQKTEEVFTPSNKYQNRKTSQFGQKLASEAKARQPMRQPQLEPEPVSLQQEEQPRYRSYASSRPKPNRPNGDVNNNDRRQSGINSFSAPNSSERMFAPQVYAAMGLQEYGTHNPMNTSSRALPLSQMGAPPPPGGALIPGVPLSLHAINATINQNHEFNPYRRKVEEPKPEQVRDVREIHPRSDSAKVPEELSILESRRVVFKKDTSKIVIKQLSKYLKLGRIANKDDFKHLSRKLCHKVLKKEESTGFLLTPKTPKKIKKYVDAFFKKRPGVYVKEQKEWDKPLALQVLEKS